MWPRPQSERGLKKNFTPPTSHPLLHGMLDSFKKQLTYPADSLLSCSDPMFRCDSQFPSPPTWCSSTSSGFRQPLGFFVNDCLLAYPRGLLDHVMLFWPRPKWQYGIGLSGCLKKTEIAPSQKTPAIIIIEGAEPGPPSQKK